MKICGRIERNSLLGTFSFLTLLIFLFMTASCSSAKTETTQSIKVGLIWDLTGPVSEGGGYWIDAYNDYIKSVNEKGGIKGRKVELLWADSGYSIPRLLSNYTRFKEQGAVIIQIQSSLEALTLKPIAERDSLPLLAGTVDSHYPPGWVFTAGNGATPEHYAVFLKWLKSNWKESRAPRIAVIGWDNTLGKAPLAAAKFTGEMGAVIVAQEFVPVPSVDYSSALLRIKAASPDYIFSGVASGSFGPLLKDLERLGMRGTIPIVNNGVPILETAIGPAGIFSEGLMAFDSRGTLADKDNAGIKKLQEFHKKVRGKAIESDMYTGGWLEVRAMVEFLRLAQEEEGKKELTGTAVKNAIERAKNLDMDGVIRPLNYGPDKRRGNDYARLLQIKGGKVAIMSDWIEMPVIR